MDVVRVDLRQAAVEFHKVIGGPHVAPDGDGIGVEDGVVPDRRVFRAVHLGVLDEAVVLHVAEGHAVPGDLVSDGGQGEGVTQGGHVPHAQVQGAVVPGE